MNKIDRDAIRKEVKGSSLTNESQRGFIQKRSCHTNLIQLFDEISILFDQHYCIFKIDLSKIFAFVHYTK